MSAATLPAEEDRLLEFATPVQAKAYKALVKFGSSRKAGAELGMHHSTINEHVQRLKAFAATKGWAPDFDMRKTVPDPYLIKGISTNYDEAGNVKQQWVKSNIDWQRRMVLLKEAIESIATELPRLKPAKAPTPKFLAPELINVVTLTDCHVGMYAWDKEGGGKWDLEEAERVLTGVFESQIDNAPKAETLVIAQLGDFLHYDSLEAVTPTSKHNLDASGRPGEMIKVAVRILRRIVNKGLATHKKVILVMAEGNHDMVSSIFLREMFMAWYENEPRLQVIDSDLPYYAYRHGKVALFWHHSHLKRIDGLPLLFATQYAKIWGDTEYRFGHTGDKHHLEEKEHSGIVMLQHPTLAARDAYASRHGWHALRRSILCTYHAEFGEWNRRYCTPEMLAAA